jgi:CHAT domain-containing protein/TPR repeat protein
MTIPKFEDIDVPSSPGGRADAIEHLMAVTYKMDPQEALELVQAWTERVHAEYPDDEVTWLELHAISANFLLRTGDHFAVERVLATISGDLAQRARELENERSADPRTLERVSRAWATAANLNGIEFQYTDQMETAYEWFSEALKWRRKDPRGNLLQAQTLGNMGMVKAAMGDPVTAEQHFRAALDTMLEIDNHDEFTEFPMVLTEIAKISYFNNNRYDVIKDLREALEIARKQDPVGQAIDHIHTDLVNFLFGFGSPREAENYVRHNIAASRKGTHPVREYSESQYILAHIRWSLDEPEDCADILDDAFLDDAQFIHKLHLGAEEVRLNTALAARSVVDLAVSIAAAYPDRAKLSKAAMRVVSTRKDVSNSVQTVLQRAHGVKDNKSVRDVFAELDRRKKLLYGAMLGANSLDVNEALGQVMDAESQVAVIARMVDDLSPKDLDSFDETTSAPPLFTMDQLAEAIPIDATLVEYIRYNPQPQYYWLFPELPSRYAAFVWRGGEPEPSIVALGDADVVDADVDRLLQIQTDMAAAADENGGVESFLEEHDAVARALRTRLFDPVAAAIGASKRLLISPDSRIATLSFAAFPTLGGQLIDHYEISYLDGARQLLWRSRDDLEIGPPVVIADPDYDLGLEKPSEFGFERLDGTRREGIEIAHQLGATPLLDGEATENAVRQIKSPSLLHIATHGWFLPDPDRAGGATQGDWQSFPRLSNLDHQSLRGWSVRSGLILAGFNASWSTNVAGVDDGLLTAGEASLLALDGTEMCVLSACETGRGGLFDLQGLTGLRRAFQSAGARATVTSLWRVPDDASHLLMTSFYRRLLTGEPKSRALVNAQHEVRQQFPSPFHWAGFVLHGDPHPLSPAVLSSLRDRNTTALCDTEPDTMINDLVDAALARNPGSDAAYQQMVEKSATLPLAGLIAAGISGRQGDLQRMRQLLRQAADGGEPAAAHLLAGFYTDDGDVDEARRLLHAAFDAGLTRSGVLLAHQILTDGGERGEAFGMLRTAIGQGPGAGATDATSLLGAALVEAEAFEEAEHVLAGPIGEGDAFAMSVMAGVAAARNDTAAQEYWIDRAASAGNPACAMYEASRAYENGDRDRAARLWRAAAIGGDASGAHNLGVALDLNHDPGPELWYAVGARGGVPESANNLALFLSERGRRDEAMDWWRVAIDRGHGTAGTRLGHALAESGRFDEASQWLVPAAEAGDVEAMTHLGDLYRDTGRAHDARQWYEKAADQGSSVALGRLADDEDSRGDWDEAFKLRHRMDAADEDSAYKMAKALWDNGYRDRAEPILRELALSGHSEAALTVAGLDVKREDPQSARSVLAAAAETDATARRTLEMLGADHDRLTFLAHQGHGEAAKDLFLLAALREDEPAASLWVEKAADAGLPDARSLAAQWALGEGRWHDAVRWLLPLARQGYSDAAAQLISAYRGLGATTEPAQWEARVPALRRADAELTAGWECHSEGDSEGAHRHFEIAMELGSIYAMRNLTYLFLTAGRSDDAAHWQQIGGLVDYRMANDASLGFFAEGDTTNGLLWLRRATRLAQGHDVDGER